jgi:hypothetical protein
MTQPTIQQTFELALRNHQAGQLRQAVTLYIQILTRVPEHVTAIHYLGVAAHQK